MVGRGRAAGADVGTNWKELAERFPEETLVRDPAAYADVFAAIDEAAARARTVEPSPDECEVVCTVPAEEPGDEDRAMFLWRVPVVPVRVPSTVRLCVGLLQYYRWPVARSAEGACLPHVDTLLKRKLRPTLDEAVDLAAFLMVRVRREVRANYSEPSATILKLIENNFPPPVPGPLAEVLREVRRRVDVVREYYVEMVKSSHGRPKTRRFDRWNERLDRLLGGSTRG